MKKELKDYIHLYLGCRIKSKGGKIGDLVSVSNDGMSIVVYDKDKINDPRGLCVNSDWLLLILRPLSDLTTKIEHDGQKFAPSEVLNTDFSGITTETTKFLQFNIAMDLISWHFDLFGLIEAGLAIDAKTLQSNLL